MKEEIITIQYDTATDNSVATNCHTGWISSILPWWFITYLNHLLRPVPYHWAIPLSLKTTYYECHSPLSFPHSHTPLHPARLTRWQTSGCSPNMGNPLQHNIICHGGSGMWQSRHGGWAAWQSGMVGGLWARACMVGNQGGSHFIPYLVGVKRQAHLIHSSLYYRSEEEIHLTYF